MQIIFGKKVADNLRERMTILELDTFFQEGLSEPLTTYAVLESQDIPIQDLTVLPNLTNLHEKMMEEYKKKNWSFCEQALEHLQGKWGGAVDSFYEIFKARVRELSVQDLPENWNGVIYKN